MNKANEEENVQGNLCGETATEEVEFDDLLTNYIGEFGRYQWFVLFVLCYEWMISVFVALNATFVAGVPDHWCHITDNVNISTCTQNQIKKNLLPKEEREGIIQHSQCERYDYELQNVSFGCTGIGNNIGVNGSSQLPTIECNKWFYDNEIYYNTIVTEVIIQTSNLCEGEGLKLAYHLHCGGKIFVVQSFC